MKRRFLTLALALILALSLAAVPSLAAGETAQVYTNMSAAAVNDFGTQPHAEAFRPLIVVEDADLLLERVSVYHWNGGAGAAPGTVSVYDNATRQLVGTWQATGREGNTWWDIYPDLVLKAGKTYYLDCSDRLTWSFGGESGTDFLFEYTAGPAPETPAPVEPEPAPAQPEPAPAQPEPAPAQPEPAPAQPEPAPAVQAQPAASSLEGLLPSIPRTPDLPYQQLYTSAGGAVADFNILPQVEVFRPVFGANGTNIVLQALSVPHWNSGAGAEPGTISLYDAATLQLVGTWQAVGREGNTWWDVFPNVELEVRKTYVIDCSDRQTWSFGGDGRPTFAFAAYGYHLPAPVPPIDLAMYSYPNCSVVVNGTPVQWSAKLPYIDTNSRSMAMLAPIAQALGLTVEWDEYLWEARFSDGVDTLAFPIGSSCAYADNGAVIHMDTMAAVRDGDIFTPIRCLAEFFGWTVEWGDSYKTVYITG